MSIEERPDVDTDSDDCCFGDVGFMFDNALPKTRRSFQFGDISVAVRLVDDDPGAVQSGHYVWPAAPALSAYLVDRQSALPRASKCLELGAGCGLAGLVAAQLPSTRAVVFTDHDPGVLDLIRDSIAEQKQEPELGGTDAGAKCRCIQLSWGPVGERENESETRGERWMNAKAHPLAPGPRKDQRELLTEALANVVGSCASTPPPKREDSAEEHCGGGGDIGGGPPFFDLVIASDAIYSVSVVEPLFQTVSGLLRPKASSRSSSKLPSVYVGCGNGAATDPQTSSRGDKITGAETDRGGALSDEYSEAVDPHVTTLQGLDGGGVFLRDGGGGSGAGGSPVFLMSQSFGYDAETERAIEQACLELGLVRQVVWDELMIAPGASKHERKEQQGDRPDGVPTPEKRLHATSNGSSIKTSSVHDEELLPLSKERRAGTKLQRFWRA
ncbi:unnamed protein product [Scytosiphon promiscuus]